MWAAPLYKMGQTVWNRRTGKSLGPVRSIRKRPMYANQWDVLVDGKWIPTNLVLPYDPDTSDIQKIMERPINKVLRPDENQVPIMAAPDRNPIYEFLRLFKAQVSSLNFFKSEDGYDYVLVNKGLKAEGHIYLEEDANVIFMWFDRLNREVDKNEMRSISLEYLSLIKNVPGVLDAKISTQTMGDPSEDPAALFEITLDTDRFT